MDPDQSGVSHRLEFLIAILIAIVSTTIALVAWRISAVSSGATDAGRLGIINSIKKQAAMNEDWRMTYQEANYAVEYAVYLAQVQALEASGDPVAEDQASNLRQYLLPNLQLIASPLASEEVYQNPDGTYDLQKRFEILEAEDSDLNSLDPQASFLLADRFYAEQRWLTSVSVILAVSLFWLALAEIGGKRLRLLTLIVGGSVYGVGLVALALIEIIFTFFRRGVL